MLEENKQLYRECADVNLPGWKEMSKSDLCNIYINTQRKAERDGSLAAIICKCWNIFNSNYRKQPYIPLEEWYDSMIEAILYVLKNHVWTDPKNTLYGKPNGPEMALHRCIWSRKLNVYCANKKPKRIINLNICSTDDLKERAGVDPACELDEEAYIFKQYISVLVEKDKLEYGIILDLLGTGTALQSLAKDIRGLNNEYIEYFSMKYLADKKQVEKIITSLQNNKQLSQYIDYYLTCLQRDSDTLDYIN